jgi:sarcosine oxidase
MLPSLVGPWIQDFVDQRELVLFRIYRQVLTWFGLRPDAIDHSPGVMPVFIWGLSDGEAFYGFPEVDGAHTVKVATEQLDVATTAESASLDVDASETASAYDVFGPRLPALTSKYERAVRCLYTVTPDANFVVDEHPDLPGVLLVSPCSGHGFKHSAGLGEAIAQLVTSGTSDVDLSPFRIGRFAEFRAAG